MKELAGGRDDWQHPGDAPKRITWEAIQRYAPEVLILSPCSSSLERTLGEVGALAAQPGWWALPAVKAGQVYICQHAPFSRPGPRYTSPPPGGPPCLPNGCAVHTLLRGCGSMCLGGTRWGPFDVFVLRVQDGNGLLWILLCTAGSATWLHLEIAVRLCSSQCSRPVHHPWPQSHMDRMHLPQCCSL